MASSFVSSWVCVAVYVLALAGALLELTPVSLCGAFLLVAYIALEFSRISRGQIFAGTLLSVVGLGAAALGRDWWAATSTGLIRAESFFLLFAAVAWLQVPVDRSLTMRAAQERAMRQPPGRRYAVLMLVAHILGSVLNLAGISLLSSVIREQPNANLVRRLTRAIAQGFTAASCWTPFFIAMTVVLSVVPGLRWSDLAPIGLAAAAVLVGLGWAMDRLFFWQKGDRAADTGRTAELPPFDWRVGLIPVTLFAAVIILVEGAQLSIPIALGIIAPVYATVWVVVQSGRSTGLSLPVRDLGSRVWGSLPGLRNETFLFLAANLLGTGAAAALPPETTKAAVDALNLSPDASIVLIMGGILVLGAAGLHPLIVFVLVGEVLPPEVLNLPAPILGAALLSMWGIGAVVSPLSGISLYLSRATGVAPWRLAWLWNGPYAVIGTAVAAALIIVTRHLGFQ